VSRSPLLAAPVSGSSAWIVWQLLDAPLQQRIRQLEVDPHVPGEVVRHLRGTAAGIEEAARQYREWSTGSATSATEATEVSHRGGGAGSGLRPAGMDVGSVAAGLGCSPRWVTQLIAMGRLAATKHGRSWRIDPDSVRDYLQGGAVNAA
jgi:excisionase family DNA binding protein